MTSVNIDSERKKGPSLLYIGDIAPTIFVQMFEKWENICKKSEDYESLQYSCKCLERWVNICKKSGDYNQHHLSLLSIPIIVDIEQAKYDRIP